MPNLIHYLVATGSINTYEKLIDGILERKKMLNPQEQKTVKPKPKDKIDEDFARYCKESKEKIPIAPLTLKEKELLQKTLTKDALSEGDFAIMAIRQKLWSTNPTGPFHDDRRPLPL